MLVLSRKEGERIVLESADWDYPIVLELSRIMGDRVRIGLTAPASVSIRREELAPLPLPGVPFDLNQRETT